MRKQKEITTLEPVERRILLIRGHRVILNIHLAELYGVSTGRLMEQIKRNRERFPPDFLFQLTKEEFESLKSQFAISKEQGRGGRRHLPYAFTEHGAVMAANVLKSKRAIQVSIYVVRAFVRLRQLLSSHRDLAEKFDELERTVATHDKAICSLFDAIRKLITSPEPKRRRIGFIVGDQKE